MSTFVEQTYSKLDVSSVISVDSTYELCVFENCQFKDCDFTKIKFIECEFFGCDLSLANLTDAAFRDVRFTNCKMLGLHFENLNTLGLVISFDQCVLSHSSFYQIKLKNTQFKQCTLHECDFTESDLTSAAFHQCDLKNAQFVDSILEKCDFRTANNFSIDPRYNKVKGARFSRIELAGLLDAFQIVIE
jgi:fluoroquinolone resistance protein